MMNDAVVAFLFTDEGRIGTGAPELTVVPVLVVGFEPMIEVPVFAVAPAVLGARPGTDEIGSVPGHAAICACRSSFEFVALHAAGFAVHAAVFKL